MPRKRQITRTILTSSVLVLCVNLETQETFEEEVSLPSVYTTEKALMLAVESAVNSETVKAVHVISSKTLETLYGMSEEDFIANAEILPPRGSKAESETDTNENEN